MSLQSRLITLRPPKAPASGVSRLVGIDLARFVAILGMMCVHVWVPDLGTRLGIRAWSEGNASTLFAVLGGISVVLATKRYIDAGDVAAARWARVGRGAVVIAIGLTIAFAGSPAIIVLVPFGVALWCAIPFMRAPSWVLATTATVLGLGSGVMNAAVRAPMANPQEFGSISWADLAHPLAVLRGVFSTGMYPVSTWLVYVLVGMLVGRAMAASERQWRIIALLAVSGAGMTAASVALAEVIYTTVGRSALLAAYPGLAAAVPEGTPVDALLRMPGFGAPSPNWPSLLLDSPHTGTALDITRGIGVAFLVIAACMALNAAASPRVQSLIEPVRAAGAAPLTIYTVHILALAVGTALAGSGDASTAPWYAAGPGALALHVGLALLIGTALALLHRRGPLEALTSAAARRTARIGL